MTRRQKQAPDSTNGLSRSDEFLKRVGMRFLVSSVLAMAALYAASLFNTALVGAYLGEAGLGVLSLVSPLTLFFYTAGAVIGIGGSLAISRAMGKGGFEDCQRLFTCATVLMAVTATAMVLLGYGLMEPLAVWLDGGSGNLAMVRSYLSRYLPGGAFTLMAYIPLYFLKIDGRPKTSFGLFLLCSGLQVLLTWSFLQWTALGVGGVSLAITLSMGVTAVLGFWVLLKGRGELRLRRGGMTPGNVRAILTTGIPNGLTNLLEAARILLVNFILLRIGAAALLPAYSVVRNTMDVLGAVMIGVSTALLPMLGVFYGERDYVNVRSTLRMALRVGLVVITPLMVLSMVLPNAISALFGVTSPLILAENRLALPLACGGTLFAYLNVLLCGYLTAVKRTWIANVLIAGRLLVYLALLALPLAQVLGSLGVWLSFSLTELAATLTYLLLRRLLRRRHKTLDSYLLDSALESAEDISFSVYNRMEDVVVASTQISDFCESAGITPRQSMLVALAVEELLTVMISRTMAADAEQSIDIRVRKLEGEVMMRIRSAGEIFDPIRYYKTNKNNPAAADELLGLHMIIKSASLVDFRTTFGVNNLIIIF